MALLLIAININAIFAANPIVSVSSHGYDDGYNIEYSDKSKDCIVPVVLLFINGNIVSDADVIIKIGTTIVPLRIISDKLGAAAKWDSVTKSVEITKGNANIKLSINNKIIEVNEIKTELNPSEIINSLTYVPFRAIASGFGQMWVMLVICLIIRII